MLAAVSKADSGRGSPARGRSMRRRCSSGGSVPCRRFAQQEGGSGGEQKREPAEDPPFVFRERVGRVDGFADAAARLVAGCAACCRLCQPFAAPCASRGMDPVPETVNSIALPGTAFLERKVWMPGSSGTDWKIDAGSCGEGHALGHQHGDVVGWQCDLRMESVFAAAVGQVVADLEKRVLSPSSGWMGKLKA